MQKCASYRLVDTVPLYFVICKSYLKFFAICFYRFVTVPFEYRNSAEEVKSEEMPDSSGFITISLIAGHRNRNNYIS